MSEIDIDGRNIVLDQDERKRLLESSASCPFLKWAPLIPYADKFYVYCDIRHSTRRKAGIDKSYVYHYCCNVLEELAFMNCEIWNESNEED